MSITLGAFAFNRLNAQPFAYDESDTRLGRTARKWTISGLATPSEWLDLLSVYDAWRDLRIEDEDTEISGVIGTTVTFSGSGPGGQAWTNVPCWFISAPTAEQSGAFLSINSEIIDATQALEVILKEAETTTTEETPDFGTITIGTTVVTLTKPVDGFVDGPQLELTATGTHYLSGALTATKIKDVEGTTNLTGWNNIRAWYETQISTVPLTNSYFPISAPTASAEIKTVNGVKTTVYTVSIQLALVK